MNRPTETTTLDVPTEIASDVYCLGPRGPTQTNVYFVRSGPSWSLIDAGWAKDASAIKHAAESLFGTETPPASILLTHAHPDHVGSALQLARSWACAAYVHPEELPLASGDFAAMTKYAGPLDRWVILPLMRVMGRRRREAILAASSIKGVTRSLDETGVPGLAGWEWIHTPGHTPGHVSFFRPSDRVMITGDAVVMLRLNSLWGVLLQKRGLSGPPWYTSWNWPAAKESVLKLASLEPNLLATGHGRPLTGTETTRELRCFADQFAGRR